MFHCRVTVVVGEASLNKQIFCRNAGYLILNCMYWGGDMCKIVEVYRGLRNRGMLKAEGVLTDLCN